MEPNYDIPLHDIKPLLEIQEYSLYYLVALGVVALIIILGTAYLLFVWIRNRNRFNIRKEHHKILDAVNFSDTKQAAYDLTFYGATFKEDTPRHTKTYDDLLDKLQNYKYKKSVESFDGETLRIIELYRGMIDV